MIQTENHFTEILERITDAFVALDKNWRYTYMNKKAGEIFQRDPQQMIGKHIWTEFPEGIGQPFHKAYEKAMAEQKYIYLEEYYAPYDLWFENHIYPSPDGLSIYFRDITERKKQELNLTETEERYRNFIEGTHDLVQSIGANGEILFVNKAWEDAMGYSESERATLRLFDIIHAESQKHCQEIFQRVLGGQAVSDMEILFVKKDGGKVILEGSAYPRIINGEVVATQSFLRDVSEKKKAEEDLRMAHQRLTSHLHNTPLAIIEWDKNLIIQKWSPQAEKIFGWKEAEVANKHFNDFNLVYKEDAQAVGIIAQQLMTGAVDQNRIINRNNTKDGKVIYCQWFNSVLKDEQGKTSSIMSLIKDISERKEAEMILNKEVARRKHLLNNANDGIFVLDHDFRVVETNIAFANLLGRTSEETIGTFPWDWDVVYSTKEILNQTWPELPMSVQKFETKFRHKNGTVFDAEITGSPAITDWDGQMLMLFICRDITERKKAEAALMESNYSLSESQRIAKTGSWTYYMSGELKWSDNVSELYGLPSKITDPTPEFFFELVHADDREKMQKWMQAILAGEAPEEYEFRSTLPDGSIHYYSGSGELKYDKTNTPVYLRGTVQDITERKKAEQEIQKLATVVQRSPEFIGIAGLDAKAIYLNDGGKKIVGLDREITTTTMWDFFAPEDLGVFKNKIIPAIEKEGRWVGDINLKHFRTGERIPVLMDIFHVYHPQTNEPIAFATVTADITERKKAEQEILQMNEQLRNLSSHLENIREEERMHIAREIHDELGQQLSGIMIDLSWLNRKSKTGEMKKRVEDMMQLVDLTIKTVRKISSDLRPAILDDLGLISALVWYGSEFELRTGIRFSFNCKLEEQTFEKNFTSAVFRIFQELLTNVSRHASAGKVDVSLEKENDNIILSVHDNGKGFDEQEAKEKKSLGILGMKERANMLSGNLVIESKIKQGTTVTLTVPVPN